MPNPAPPDESELLRLDNQFCFALYALSRQVIAQYRPLLDPIGLTYPQYLVMLVLWEAQGKCLAEQFAGVTVKFVGQRLFLDSGTLTPLLKRLEANGLLQRTRSTADEREVRLKLTRAGQQLRQNALEMLRDLAACEAPIATQRLQVLQVELQQLLESARSRT